MALTFFESSVSAGGGNGVPAGLFLPIADLPGVVAGEFADAQSQATKESKAALAIANAIHDYLSANSADIVGMTSTRAKASVSDILDNLTFSFACQYVADLETETVGQIPLPASGANSGVGGFALDDLFANAAEVAEEDAITGEGVVIPYADLVEYGGSDPAAITGVDNRDFVAAMIRAFPAIVPVRSASVASGVTSISQAAGTTFTLPAAATAETDPTTGLTAADLPKIAALQFTTSWTVQVALDQAAQTFDVNVVTA
ncbi:hypothetical protein AWQ21_09615 [Picosynechococcus sp. PCC 7003]|uniref:hypothetical protein n=1 Tax=Picosynechococcus sp. PCC 7003 TaxID=374981 RepID=UPI0008109687|nr:hypothetical protein [Picosynechococcus sp. PCC 7003]ANV84619.1 hypothetical protein AWQ21_09615 [Picosynechococcus sp. PCC 7003]